jgi:hypothetical protein
MNDANIYFDESVDGCDVINQALTDALKDGIEMRDIDKGWALIVAQLDFYGVSADSDKRRTMLDDYAAGVLGLMDEDGVFLER